MKYYMDKDTIFKSILFIVMFVVMSASMDAIGTEKRYIVKGTSHLKSEYWVKWEDKDGNCLNTRDEVLKRESITEAVIKNCKVVKGLWQGYFSLALTTDPKKLVVIPVVPIEDVNESGGNLWSWKKKRAYYQDLSDPRHLIVARKDMFDRNGRPPQQWMPSAVLKWKIYLQTYAEIKDKWNLSYESEKEKQSMLDHYNFGTKHYKGISFGKK